MKLRRIMACAFLALVASSAFASDASDAFNKLKALEGSWDGVVAGTKTEVDGRPMHISMRVTSMGNAMMHETTAESRLDHPLTVFYLDGDRLMLTHYCDAGNRPRMTGKMSADGKTVEFEFLDVAGSTEYGHMHHAAFTFIDANHHIEDWTYMHGDKPTHAHFELQRAK